jgi:hypothetical protein
MLGALEVTDLSRSRIKPFLAEKLNSGLPTSRVRLVYAVVRLMLESAVDDGLLIANPAHGLGASSACTGRLLRGKR